LPALAAVLALAAGAAHAESGLSCAQGPCGVADYDGDMIKDWADNCPLVGNKKQQDNDKDTPAPVVDAGDPPPPVNNTTGPVRLYPSTPYQSGNTFDTDIPKEAGGDNCDVDDDNDGVYDKRTPGHKGPDNCRFIPNPDQADADRDGEGDLCDKQFNPPALAAAAKVKVAKVAARRYDELGSGLIVGVRCTAACSVAGELKAGRTVIGRGNARLDGAGHTFLIVRIPSASLRNLSRKVRRLRTTLAITTIAGPKSRTVARRKVLLHR
jgi:hypothetical protein